MFGWWRPAVWDLYGMYMTVHTLFCRADQCVVVQVGLVVVGLHLHAVLCSEHLGVLAVSQEVLVVLLQVPQSQPVLLHPQALKLQVHMMKIMKTLVQPSSCFFTENQANETVQGNVGGLECQCFPCKFTNNSEGGTHIEFCALSLPWRCSMFWWCGCPSLNTARTACSSGPRTWSATWSAAAVGSHPVWGR